MTTTAGGVISEGTETFAILNGTTQIGQTTSPVQVQNGSATASYTLPGNTPPGQYIIEASYSGSVNYLPSTDIRHFLTVTPASTTTTVSNASATYSDVSDQSIPLSAQVSSAAGSVNEGTVTFTILSGGNPVGGAVSASVVTWRSQYGLRPAFGYSRRPLHNPGGLYRPIRLQHVQRYEHTERGRCGDHDHND